MELDYKAIGKRIKCELPEVSATKRKSDML